MITDKHHKLEVVSTNKPIGEQEKAINKIVENFNSGVKYQTLLGVTGSGKSLIYDEPVLIYEKVGRKFRPYLIEIGQLVEDASYATKELYVPSINPQNGLQELKPVTQFTKHKSPRYMYKVITTCGKEIEVTGDHNFWVLRNGEYKLVKTEEILISDYLPIPRCLKASEIKFIDNILITNYLEAGKTYFKYADIENKVNKMGLLEKLGYQKYYHIYHSNEGVDVSNLSKFNLSDEAIRKIKIYKKGGDLIPNSINIDDDLLSLLGIYIAEGHSSDHYLLFSVHEFKFKRILKMLLNNLDIKYKERNNNKGDFQISNSILNSLFAKLCGKNSHNKQLPEWFLQLNNKQLARLLSAYFSGDGTVTENEIQAVSASKKLVSDLSYSLLRYGINVRIRKKTKFATNTTKKTKRMYFELVISGKDNLTKFFNSVGFSLERKHKKLKEIIKAKGNTNVDLTPIDGRQFKSLRKKIGLTHRTLSSLVDCERSYFSMIENNSRKPSNSLMCKILKIFRECTNSKLLLQEINKLDSLTKTHFTKVKCVNKISPTSDYVYDIAVKDNETFLAGMGGIYVHNTFTSAKVIEKLNKPTLIMSHNKTLAAQLYQEMHELFPNNAVSYFVSYYDYYQPESYIPSTDTYIEKDSAINELIDKLRLAATANLLTRPDCVVVASVSSIYNIGSPNEYGKFAFEFVSGMKIGREQIMDRIIDLQYERSEFGFNRGTFRVRGDSIDIYPAYSDDGVRIELGDEKINSVKTINTITGEVKENITTPFVLYPAKHFMTDPKTHETAFTQIKNDLDKRVSDLRGQNKLLEAQRIAQRVNYDLEMIKEIGYVKGIENYSRYFDGRNEGDAPFTLIDFFKENAKKFGKNEDDFLVIVDESHITFPQVRGMYNGDRSRKTTLIDYGFRLPSALDNRPLKFDEFMRKIPNFLALSATPDEWELSLSEKNVVEQLVRPTGIPDPIVTIKPTTNQVKDVIEEIKEEIKNKRRVLVTTLTKKTAEDLSEYLQEQGLKVAYLHSDVDTLDRTDILDNLRKGNYDCLVGINLLREGLDLPEVGLVAILDADKEGFLRSQTALIQTMGRAARHVEGRVIMYADRITGSMERALSEVKRRREYQIEMNKKYGITPKSIIKPIREKIIERQEDSKIEKALGLGLTTFAHLPEIDVTSLTPMDKKRLIKNLQKEMQVAAKDLNFELAIEIREKINKLN